MTATAELAERLDVRLHTHLAEDLDEDDYCLERFGRRPVDQFAEVGWLTPRAWVAHCIYPDASEITRLGAAGVGVAHCPSSNMILGNGLDCRCATCARPGRRWAWAATGRRRTTWLAVAGGPHRAAARQAARRRGGGDGPGRARPRDPRRRGVPGPRRGDRRADGRAPAATSWSGRLDRDRASRARCSDPVEAWLRCGPGRRARRSWPAGSSSRTACSRWRGSTTSWPATAPRPCVCRTRRAANGCHPFGRVRCGAGRCRGDRAVTAPQPRDVPSWSDPLVASTSRHRRRPAGQARADRPVPFLDPVAGDAGLRGAHACARLARQGPVPAAVRGRRRPAARLAQQPPVRGHVLHRQRPAVRHPQPRRRGPALPGQLGAGRGHPPRAGALHGVPRAHGDVPVGERAAHGAVAAHRGRPAAPDGAARRRVRRPRRRLAGAGLADRRLGGRAAAAVPPVGRRARRACRRWSRCTRSPTTTRSPSPPRRQACSRSPAAARGPPASCSASAAR